MRWSTGVPETATVHNGLPATLRFYRFVMTAAAPLAPLLLSYRLRRGKENPARLPERRGETDRKSTRLNSSHIQKSRMPSSA